MAKTDGEWWAGEVGSEEFRLGWGRTRAACLLDASGNMETGDRLDLVLATIDPDAEPDENDLMPFSGMSERETLELTETGWKAVSK